MGLTVDTSTPPVDTGGSVSAAIDTALAAQAAAADVGNADAMLGSIGLGGNFTSSA